MRRLAGWIGASVLAALLLASVAASTADCNSPTTCHHRTLPLAYDVENTGASFPAPAFPSFGQLPIVRPLPDPFMSFARSRRDESRRDTAFASWERRRNEIKAAIEKYEIGPKPDCSDCTITASYTPPPAGSTAKGVLKVVVTRNGKSLTLTSGVYIPTGMGSGPFPVLIPMTFFASATGANPGSLPAGVVTSRPIATIDFVHNDVTGLSFGHVDHSADAFYQLYPELCAGTCNGTVSNSGQYAAWSWGVSRLIDGIEIVTHQPVNPLPVDMKHVAVTGCSYAGKMALFAGALDERIALTIAQENGGGGAPAWRVSHEIEADGSVEDIHDTNYDWFAGQMLQFAGENGYKLPIDHDELMAMVAPRALLETGNTDFYWLSNRSNYISARATQRIYKTFGIGDRFGFYIDGGHPHCGTLPAEAPAIAAYLDKFLLGDGAANTAVEVNPYPTLDYSRWTAWWGRDDESREVSYPKFPNDWNTAATVVSALRPGPNRLHINAGDTVLAGYQVGLRSGGHPAATVSLVSGTVEADVHCFDGNFYTLTIALPPNQSYSIAANDDSFFPDPAAYQSSATATQCSGVLEGAYFSALGVSSGAGNPGGPGFTTSDTTDPLQTRFQLSANGARTRPSAPLTVDFNP